MALLRLAAGIANSGTPAGNTQYDIDGAPAMSGTRPAFMPPPRWWKKSGTNELHGSLYWFHNDIVLQGMDTFQRQQLYNPATGPVTPRRSGPWRRSTSSTGRAVRPTARA